MLPDSPLLPWFTDVAVHIWYMTCRPHPPRSVVTSGFPYAVRYRVTGGRLVVMAVYHQRRRPTFGADRVP